ncbi:MAG: S8 family serine peptidase [Promethearchaeota archaeon]
MKEFRQRNKKALVFLGLLVVNFMFSSLILFNMSSPKTFKDHNEKSLLKKSLTNLQAKNEEYVPIIILFKESGKTNILYKNFINKYPDPVFKLKYKFQIIPAISGYFQKKQLLNLANENSIVNVFENKILNLNLRLKINKNFEVIAHSSSSNNGSSWWKEYIGVNNTVLNGLDGTGIKVGIIDTGIGYSDGILYTFHKDLQGKIKYSINFASGTDPNDLYDEYGHGTHVAGIIAASGESSGGLYSGIAPGVEIYNIKVLNSTGSGFEDDIIAGIEWSVNNSLDIINLSLGGGVPDPKCPESLAVRNATEQGVIVVTSAGNEGPRYMTGLSPGASESAITVGSSNYDKNVSTFSSRGPNFEKLFDPDVIAPGEDIISTLAHNSFLERYYQYYNLLIKGNAGEQNNYVSLSGTSMAAPVVSAACALIKEKFNTTNLSPYLVQLSLMQTAQDLGFDASTQGMGQINVSAAIIFLEQLINSGKVNSVAKIFPKKLPYAPFNIVNFPGESVEMGLKVIYNTSSTVMISVSNPFTSEGIEFNLSNVSLTGSGIAILNFSIKTSKLSSLGNYNSTILIKNALDEELDSIEINFTLKAPRFKVYIDTFHSVKDQFSTSFRSDYIGIDYYPLMNFFQQHCIETFVPMEYWTRNYNASRNRNFFTYPFIKTFDLIIIPSLKLDLFTSEKLALKSFYNEGGDLIVMGDRYQRFSVKGVNDLLSSLGLQIQFKNENFEDFIDNGWEYYFKTLNLTNIEDSHFLLENISGFDWKSGSIISTLDNDVDLLVSNSNQEPMLVFEQQEDTNGSILVGGSEAFFSSYREDRQHAPNVNKNIIQNLKEYYKNQEELYINGFVSNLSIMSEENLSYHVNIWDNNESKSLSLTDLDNISCILSNSTGKIEDIVLTNYNSTWIGNESLNVSTLTPSIDPYKIILNFSYRGKNYSYNLGFMKLLASQEEINASILNSIDYRNCTFEVVYNSSIQDAIVNFNGYTDNAFSEKIPYSDNILLNNSNELNFIPSFSMPSGSYYINTMLNGSLYIDPYKVNQRINATLLNDEPVIDKNGSIFKNYQFNSIDLGNGLMQVINVNMGEKVEIILKGYDHETNIEKMKALVIYYPTYIINNSVGIIPYGVSLIKSPLAYNNLVHGFKGSIIIPESLNFNVNGEELIKKTSSTSEYSGAILIILRDDDGNYDYFFILLSIKNTSFTPLMSVLIYVIAIAAVFMIYFIIRNRGNREMKTKMNYINESPSNIRKEPIRYDLGRVKQIRFCPYCGGQLLLRKNGQICPNCGSTFKF